MKISRFHLLLLAVQLAVILQTSSAGKKIVCYYGSWASYRQGNGQFNVDNIDPSLCTHLIYSFVGIGSDGSVKLLDPWNDLSTDGGKGSIDKFNALRNRNPQLKTIAAIGGWNAGSATFSPVTNNPSLRKNFVSNVVAFLKQYKFDGFDLDWEYPAQNGGSPNDKVAFNLLIQQLRSEFDKYGYSLSAAVPAGRNSIQTSYDVATLGKYLDFINVMAYDYHGSWESVTGHNAPLYPRSSESGDAAYLNVQSTIQYWIDNGAPREKVILGVGSYGRSWTLSSTSNTGVGAPATGAGNPGPLTSEAGMLGYNEICIKIKNGGWISKWDDQQKVPYAYSGNQWVSYDNPDSIALKVNYAVQQGLGGVMTWSIDTDDFLGLCNGIKFPILNAMKNILSTGNSSTSPAVPLPVTTIPTIRTPATPPQTQICTKPGYVRDPSNCAKFYYCMLVNNNYIAYTYTCPSGTAFDQDKLICNYTYSVKC